MAKCDKCKCPCACPKKRKPAAKKGGAKRGPAVRRSAPAPIVINMERQPTTTKAPEMAIDSRVVLPEVAIAKPPISKPAKYQRQPVSASTLVSNTVIQEPSSRRNISAIKEKMKSNPEPYNPVLGVNIPVKREGQFIKKETGLFVPETRGATTLEERQIKSMMGQTTLDKFIKK